MKRPPQMSSYNGDFLKTFYNKLIAALTKKERPAPGTDTWFRYIKEQNRCAEEKYCHGCNEMWPSFEAWANHNCIKGREKYAKK